MKIRIYSAFFLISIVSMVYGQQDQFNILERHYIFPPQDQHVHGSSIVELPSGDFLAAWFQGSGERTADDVQIMAAKYSAKNRTWGESYVLADTEGLPDCNPVLFMHKNKLYLTWIAVHANRWEYSIIKIRKSVDFEGQQVNWEWQDNILLKPDQQFVEEVKNKFKELPRNEQGWAEYAPKYDDLILKASEDPMKRSFGWMTRIKPLTLSNGRILLPVYSDGLNFSLIAYSDDDGTTWKPSLPIVGRGNIQPALIENSHGHIVAYMRDTGDKPSLLQYSVSTDKGITWSVNKEVDIPSTASVDAVKIAEDNWFLVLNDIERGRWRLSLYQSKDEGKNWTRIGSIVDDEHKEGSHSYPAMIVASNGLVHLTYSHHRKAGFRTIEHVVIDPKTIK